MKYIKAHNVLLNGRTVITGYLLCTSLSLLRPAICHFDIEMTCSVRLESERKVSTGNATFNEDATPREIWNNYKRQTNANCLDLLRCCTSTCEASYRLYRSLTRVSARRAKWRETWRRSEFLRSIRRYEINAIKFGHNYYTGLQFTFRETISLIWHNGLSSRNSSSHLVTSVAQSETNEGVVSPFTAPRVYLFWH